MNNKKLKIHKDHIRTQFTGLDSLKSSIKKDGLIEPIIVDKDGNVIGGARRFHALNKRVKKSDIRVVDTKDVLRHQLLMELHHENLNTMDLARALVKYQQRTKQSGRKCADDLGIDQTFYRRTVKLTELPAELQHKIYTGEVAPSSHVVRRFWNKRDATYSDWKEFSKESQYSSIINSINRVRSRIEISDLDVNDLNIISDKLVKLTNWINMISKNRK